MVDLGGRPYESHEEYCTTGFPMVLSVQKRRKIMINISKRLRRAPHVPLREKWNLLCIPEIYRAENVEDFLKNRNNIHYPWYKDFPIGMNKSEARAFFFVENVQLTSLCIPNTNKETGFYTIQDATGKVIVNWDENRGITPPANTFKSVQERDGLKNGDWVYTIVILYLKNADLPLVSEVQKHKSQQSVPNSEKNSLIEMISDFSPQLAPSQ